MFAVNPIDPSLSPIRWVLPPGPFDPYPRAGRRLSRGSQHGHLQPMAAVLFAAIAAFGLGFVAGASDDMGVGPAGYGGPMPGEFRLGPGNLPPPGIVVPLA